MSSHEPCDTQQQIEIFPNAMTNNHSARQPYARLLRRASTFGIVAVALTMLFWPTRARRVERLLTKLSEALACDGPLTIDREKAVREALESYLSQETTVAVADPGGMNGAFGREELGREFALLCANTSHFRLTFSQVAVDASEQAANVRADVAIQYGYSGRAEKERRQGRLSLQLRHDTFRLVSVELGPNIVNQPEPRP